MTLLFFSDISWDSLHQRPQYLAEKLSKRCNIIFIEPMTLGHIVSWGYVYDRVYRVQLPQLPLYAKNKIIRRIAYHLGRFRLTWWLLTQAQRLMLRKTGEVAIVENFQFYGLVKALNCEKILFDYIDDAFAFNNRLPGMVKECFTKMIQLATMVNITHMSLLQPSMQWKYTYITNGVNVEDYRSWKTRKKDLPEGDIAIYIGSINFWFDFKLMDYIVRYSPHIQFVILGPVHPDVKEPFELLKKYQNFHYLGTKGAYEIPYYLSNAKVGLIPFKVNKLTAAVDPVKMYEYSAASIPTVTTDFNDKFKDYPVFRAKDEREFHVHVLYLATHNISDTTKFRIKMLAKYNEWQQKANTIAAILNLPEEREIKRFSSMDI